MDHLGKVICEVSNKHCHLTESAMADISVSKRNDISQVGQWAANEKFNDGQDSFRIIMPPRDNEQFEMSLTDWIKRFGRDKEPNWKRNNETGYVVVVRHLHITPDHAEKLNLKDGDHVSIKKDGVRAGVLNNILVRVSPAATFRVHLDTDEANALYIKNGEEVELLA